MADQKLKKDAGKAPLHLLPFGSLKQVAEVLAFGADKYEPHGWRKGMEWSRLIGAVLRHFHAWAEGEDRDPETNLSHLAHAACGVLFLLEYERARSGTDDRYKPPRTDAEKRLAFGLQGAVGEIDDVINRYLERKAKADHDETMMGGSLAPPSGVQLLWQELLKESQGLDPVCQCPHDPCRVPGHDDPARAAPCPKCGTVVRRDPGRAFICDCGKAWYPNPIAVAATVADKDEI